ncbi:MAG: DUF167 domain-containing protein [Candidatus Dojkabacteria bacterium]
MLHVIVKANSKENKVVLKEDTYFVYTKSPAKEGKANDSVISLLADYLGVSKRSICIKIGKKSKKKLVEIV